MTCFPRRPDPKRHRAAARYPGGRAINNLDSITCTARSNCWAVGVFTGKSKGFLNQTVHWNGRKWAHVSAPNPGGTQSSAFNILEGVSCVSPSNCWAAGDMETNAYFNVVLPSMCVAVGFSNTSGGASLNQVLRFNGKKWTRVKTPHPGGMSVGSATEPLGVYCAFTSSCRAVGVVSSGSALLNLALHWNGNSWSDN